MTESSADPGLLGEELARARAALGESLKTVGDAVGVSAAYVQKLERGQVESPSPRILRALSAHLGLSYERVMRLIGYEVPRRSHGRLDRVLADARLDQREQRAVAAFVERLMAERPQSRPQRRPTR